MKIKLLDAAKRKLQEIKNKVTNAFSTEGAEAAAALRDLIDELEAAEVEIDEKELAKRMEETIRAFNGNADEEVPAAVANALAAKFAEMQSKMPVSDKLTPKVKNEVSAAILRARGKDEVENAVKAVLTKNGISGLTFEETVDFAINEAWGSSNRLFDALKKTPFSKFFYSTDDVDDAGVMAHGWDKSGGVPKTIQGVTVQGKTISTQYIYKRQQIAQEDLDDMKEAGGETTFLRWLNEELDRQIVNAICHVMLGSSAYTDISTIESLFGTGAADAFRNAVTPPSGAANKAALTLPDFRALSDSVKNPNGKAKWLVIDQTTFSQISAFIYASGGNTIYHGIDEMKGFIGVDEIYVTDLASEPVIFIPDGYWVKEKNTISVSYAQWENNVQNYQKERNIGAGVHDLKSVAFFKY